MEPRNTRWLLFALLALLAVAVVWCGLHWGRSTVHAANVAHRVALRTA